MYKPNKKKYDVEKDTAEELTEMQKKFRQGRSKERKQFKDQTNAGYYTVLIFQTREQAEEFNSKVGEKPSEVFIDGLKVAKILGVGIKNETPPMPKFRVSKSFNHLT